MKKINYLLLGLFAFFTLTAGVMYHSGTPGQKSGSPGDGGSTCIQCHSGNAVTPATGWITSDIPANGYTPGTTYNITLNGAHAGAQKYGFEMTCEDGNNDKQGAFAVTVPAENQLVFGSSDAITHTGGGTSPTNDAIAWSFQWTAPAAGTGDLTFYAAVNACNGNGNTSGDFIYTTTLAASELIVTGIDNPIAEQISIYPNPAVSTLNISGVNDKVSNIILINAVGQEVRNIANSGTVNTMNVNDLEKGLYFLNIVSAENIKTERVLIQ